MSRHGFAGMRRNFNECAFVLIIYCGRRVPNEVSNNACCPMISIGKKNFTAGKNASPRLPGEKGIYAIHGKGESPWAFTPSWRRLQALAVSVSGIHTRRTTHNTSPRMRTSRAKHEHGAKSGLVEMSLSRGGSSSPAPSARTATVFSVSPAAKDNCRSRPCSPPPPSPAAVARRPGPRFTLRLPFRCA